MKKTLLLIIVVTILLSLVSCKNNDLSSPEISGSLDDRYNLIELFKDAELDMVYKVTPLLDGNFLIYGSDQLSEKFNNVKQNKFRFLLVDEAGSTLKEINIEKPNLFYRYGMGLDSDENITFLGFKNQSLELLKYNMEGELLKKEKVRVEQNISADYFTKIEISEKGLIYGLTSKGDIFIVDDKCNIVDIIDEEKHIEDFDILEDNKIIFVHRGGYLCTYNTGKKKVVKRNELDKHLFITKIEYQKDSNLIYSSEGRNIFILSESGRLKESLFNYASNTKTSKIAEIFKFADSLYLYGIKKDGNNIVFRLEENESNENNLVIAVNKYTRKLHEAIEIFKIINPDIELNIMQVGDLSEEQFFKVINTELMAGKGPDMFLGSFPFDNYMKKGFMLDLMDYMNSDDEFNSDDYIYNIIEASRVDEKQYVFPVQFMFPKLYVNKRILEEHGITIDEENWTYEDMGQIVKQICGGSNEGNYYSFKSNSFTDLYTLNINNNIDYLVDFKDKKANFNTPEFRDLLKTLKIFRDYEYLSKDTINSNVLFIYCQVSGYSRDLINLQVRSGEDYKLIKMPKWREDSKEMFNASFVGINNNSMLKDESWEFIKFLISEGYGIMYNYIQYFPINKAANNWERELNLKGYNEKYDYFDIRFGNSVTTYASYPVVSQEYSDKLDEMIKERNYHSFLSLPINEEISKFYNDEQDIEQTIRNIQNKVELFIGE